MLPLPKPRTDDLIVSSFQTERMVWHLELLHTHA